MCVRHFHAVARLINFQALKHKVGDSISEEAETEVKKFLTSLGTSDGETPMSQKCYEESTYNNFSKKHSKFNDSNLMLLSFVNVQLLYQDVLLYKKYE